MEPDSLAEEEEKENAFGANLSILTLLTASHRLELVFEEVAREDAETRTPHGCAIDCIICVNYQCLRLCVNKSLFSSREVRRGALVRNNKEENKWKNGEVGGDAFLTDICKRVFAVVEHLTGNTNTLAD